MEASANGRNISLVSWNVAGRVAKLAEQQKRIVELNADVICLQELTPSTANSWRERLTKAGWSYAATASAAGAEEQRRKRPLLTFTAARRPLNLVEIPDLPWTERALAAELAGLELVNVHSPTSPRPGLAKVLTHEAVARHLAAGTGPRLVCGDLNTPRKERADGTVWTFARDRYGRIRNDRGERWDRAELAVIKGLEQHGFRDAFRSVHGPAIRELSWEWQKWGGGYRLDHLIISTEVGVDEIRYLHEWRKAGLSDHSALYARLRW